MRSFWSDPYLWVHVAGVAAVPIFLELCWIGLAVGDPLLPVGLEFLLVAIAGIAPILWMQWQRPFCIYSLVALALKPDQLTTEQRRTLRLFKTQIGKVLAVLVAIGLLLVLWKIYHLAPLVADAVPFAAKSRLIGLLLAAIAFLGSNLFLQVPVSVVQVLLTSERQFAAADPYPIEQISQEFTLLGWPVAKILPPIQRPPERPPARAAAPAPAEVTPEVEADPEIKAAPDQTAAPDPAPDTLDAAASEAEPAAAAIMTEPTADSASLGEETDTPPESAAPAEEITAEVIAPEADPIEAPPDLEAAPSLPEEPLTPDGATAAAGNAATADYQPDPDIPESVQGEIADEIAAELEQPPSMLADADAADEAETSADKSAGEG